MAHVWLGKERSRVGRMSQCASAAGPCVQQHPSRVSARLRNPETKSATLVLDEYSARCSLILAPFCQPLSRPTTASNSSIAKTTHSFLPSTSPLSVISFPFSNHFSWLLLTSTHKARPTGLVVFPPRRNKYDTQNFAFLGLSQTHTLIRPLTALSS